VPSEIGRLTKLTGMTVSDNLLNGTIPSALGDLTNLARLLMWDNQFTGTIPSALGALTALSELWLQPNQLTGTMPFCDEGGGGGRPQHHNFTTLVAECGEVVCPCCTHCCPKSEEFGLPGFSQC
jgi:Leucine-rich repeat (LRR) protein